MSTHDSNDLQEKRIQLESGKGPTLEGHPQLGADGCEPNTNFFSSVPLFSRLDAGEIAQVLRICTIETATAGQTIFEQGEAAESMLIIERGEVSVQRRSRDGHVQIANLGDGSVVGEMALIVEGPRSATVKALAETRFYRISGRKFDALRRQKSTAAYKILLNLLTTLGDRHSAIAQRIHEIFTKPNDHIESFERQCHELAERLARI